MVLEEAALIGREASHFDEPPDANGELRDDIVIGDYKRPWNAKPEARRLAKGIPKSFLWAFDPKGISQVGCVYTAQGFEFDYVGVIFGRDLFYNPATAEWEGGKELSHDKAVKQGKERFTDLVKRTYRVLLSRGMKGCYVHFMDRETRDFVMSRIEGSRDGRVVLVQSRQISDPETGHQYTIKRYHSDKELFPDGTWRHRRIVLSPDNRKFAEIVLEDVEADSFSVVAELVQPVPDVP